jgi:hypothetical protein
MQSKNKRVITRGFKNPRNKRIHQMTNKITTKITTVSITNPFSGQSIDLTEEEHKLYNSIKELEEQEQYEPMQKAIDKFSRMNVKAYMVLVD